MAINTQSGITLTDEALDALAERWENDTWEGHLSDIKMGRPPISSEDLVTISFKLPRSRAVVIGKLAQRAGKSKSQFLRDVIDHALVS